MTTIRLLHERGVERICLDPRALFSCTSRDPAVLHAQSKKPRVPPRPAAFSQHPQVRFIGHPELEANQAFLSPWVEKVAAWIEEGRNPYIFLHTSDNRLAAALAKDYGIAAGRLVGNGVASLAPVASNSSDEGRAKNRRVELVPQ